jgi:hypothetical protein
MFRTKVVEKNETHIYMSNTLLPYVSPADRIKQELLTYVYIQHWATVFRTQVKVTEDCYPNI